MWYQKQVCKFYKCCDGDSIVGLHYVAPRGRLSSDVQPLERELRGEARVAAGSLVVSRPAARLGTEVSQVSLVALAQHGHVAARLAQVSMCLVEGLVASVQQVHLRVVQLRVALLIGIPVQLPQVSRPA